MTRPVEPPTDRSVEGIREQLEYLDALRDSGVVNMFGAAPYLADEFGLSYRNARRVVSHWMNTFCDRHPK